jgi:hypothetical protein
VTSLQGWDSSGSSGIRGGKRMHRNDSGDRYSRERVSRHEFRESDKG